MDQVVLAELAAIATGIEPDHHCAQCGHTASDHDLDNTILVGDLQTGGEGCLHGWREGTAGCDCEEFVQTAGDHAGSALDGVQGKPKA